MKRIWRQVYKHLWTMDKLPKVTVTAVVRGADGRPKLDLEGRPVPSDTSTRSMTRREFGRLQT